MARIFLSHASADKPVVRRIATALRAAGHDPWLDEDEIVVGESIPAAVERGLRGAHFVVICLSNAAAERGWVDAERDATWMQQLRERRERILPVRLEEVLPPHLIASIAYVDLFPDEQAFTDGMARLTRSIDKHEARRSQPRAASSASAPTVVDRERELLTAWMSRLEYTRPGDRIATAWTERSARLQLTYELAAQISRAAHARSPSLPPARANPEVQALSEQLERARARKQNLLEDGAPTDEVDREILQLRRRLREGGQLRAGDTLGEDRYLLIRSIGRGGFAVVWEAHDRTEQRRVAIKVLHQHLASDPQRRERFFRGARVMMELEHPAVVRVFDSRGEDDAFCYFVMELVLGGNLRDAVLNHRIDVQHRLSPVLQVGAALAEAHAKKLVHRDVKPANILIDENGDAKLTDFDLVGAHDTTGGTRTGALGTVVYAAPECLDKPQEATARADVFGLGMTAIFCLSGRELSIATFRNPVATVAKLESSIAVREVIEHAVAWEPELRFADAATMMDALRRALAGSTPSAMADELRFTDAARMAGALHGGLVGSTQSATAMDDRRDLAGHIDHDLIRRAEPAIAGGRPVELSLPINDSWRGVGTLLSREIARRHGSHGLPDGSIRIRFNGAAGNSFGAHLAPGVTLELCGDAVDYIATSMSGGRIVVYPPPDARFQPESNVIIGNAALYGATAGDLFASGLALERFAVRNVGARAVIEGVGDQGCQYMTGGVVVVLGAVGRNFAAGMTGGAAYVLDQKQTLRAHCDPERVELTSVIEERDLWLLNSLIEDHVRFTSSPLGRRVLENWQHVVSRFVKVMPTARRSAVK